MVSPSFNPLSKSSTPVLRFPSALPFRSHGFPLIFTIPLRWLPSLYGHQNDVDSSRPDRPHGLGPIPLSPPLPPPFKLHFVNFIFDSPPPHPPIPHALPFCSPRLSSPLSVCLFYANPIPPFSLHLVCFFLLDSSVLSHIPPLSFPLFPRTILSD